MGSAFFFALVLGPPLGALIGAGWLVALVAVPRLRTLSGVLWFGCWVSLWSWWLAISAGFSSSGLMSFADPDEMCLGVRGEPDLSPPPVSVPFSFECSYGTRAYDVVPEWINPVFWVALPVALLLAAAAWRSGERPGVLTPR